MKMMALLIAASFVSMPFASSRAGSDVQPRAGAAAAAVELDSYLQSEKLEHSINVADAKDSAQGPLTVKIYGEVGGSRQDALCAMMTATAKRTGTESSTVQFFALEQAPVPVNFQASRLPSGNGDVSVNRMAAPSPVYRLKRTVRL